jgi:hypothetical protein
MTRFDIIGWTFDGAAYCPEHAPNVHASAPGDGAPHDPEAACNGTGDRCAFWPRRDPAAPVFAYHVSEWEDGGLQCDVCSATIVESDSCPSCDRSIRDDHDAYTFGTLNGTSRRLVNVDRCRPHNLAVVRVRERCGRAWSIAVGEQVVPFEEDPAEALDALAAAFSGTVATFDVLTTEAVPA